MAATIPLDKTATTARDGQGGEAVELAKRRWYLFGERKPVDPSFQESIFMTESTAPNSLSESPVETPATPPAASLAGSGVDIFLAGVAGFAALIMAATLLLIQQDKKWDEARRVMTEAYEKLKDLERSNGGIVPLWIKDDANILIDLNVAADGLFYFQRGEFMFHRLPDLPAAAAADDDELTVKSSEDAKRRRWYIEVHAGSAEFESGRYDADGKRILDPPIGTARLYSTGEWEGPKPLPDEMRPQPRPASNTPAK